MKIIGLIAVITVFLSFPAVQAAETNPAPVGTDINAGTISGGSVLSPGRYVSTVAPQLNSDMAGQLKKAIGKLPGIESADASATDSTVRFTVKKNSKIQIVDLQKLVAKIDSGAVMSSPILENSMTPRPGV